MARYLKPGLMLLFIAMILSVTACQGGMNAPSDSPASSQATTTQVPNIDTSLLNVSTFKGTLDDYGYWHFVGMLTNNSAQAVTEVAIEIEVFNASSASLHKDTVYTMVKDIAPGESSPFDLWVYKALPDVTQYSARVVNFKTIDLQRIPVEITNITQVVDMYHAIILTGEIYNNSTHPVNIEGLAASLYTDTGDLGTAASTNIMQHHLEPGQSGPFRINLYAPVNLHASLTQQKFLANAVISAPADSFNLNISEFDNYLDNSGNFHLFGTLTNQSDTSLNASLVAAIYDENNKVLDVAMLLPNSRIIAPGEAIPVDFSDWGPMSFTEDGYDKAMEYSVNLDYYHTHQTSEQLVNLATKDDTNTFAIGEAKFFGKVVNDTGHDLSGAIITVGLYERGTDNLLAAGTNCIFTEIPRGTTPDYEMSLSFPDYFDPNNMEYILIVKGELP